MSLSMPERSTAEPRTWVLWLCDCGETGRYDGPISDVPEDMRVIRCTNPDCMHGKNRRAVEVVELSRCRALEAALEVAADDLGKAANQFASIREGQRAGHTPEVRSNPELFGRKEARARAALASAGPGGPDDG